MSGWQARQLAEQTGRTFVITGANSGVGLEAARDLVSRGAHVVLACRDLDRGEQARRDVADGAAGSAIVRRLDLSDLDSVDGFVRDLTDGFETTSRLLNGLVCNAGVMGGPFRTTTQGFELQMGTNHLGHAALVAGLWPALSAAAGRVVMLTSNAARAGRLSTSSTRPDLVLPQPYSAQRVYCNTKQANLLFAQELHRRAAAAASPVSAVAAHPGISWTNLFPRQMRDSGRGWLVPAAHLVRPVVFQSAAGGALPTLRALDPSTPSGAFVAPRSPGQLRGRPQLVDVYPSASDPAVAAHVWALTEQVLGRPLPS